MSKKKPNIEIPEPTEADINQTRDRVKLEYGVLIPKKVIPEFIKLVWELYPWAKYEVGDQFYGDTISEEMAENYKKLIKDKYNKRISTSEANMQLNGVAVFTAYKEKVRISGEMRAIVVKYKKVDYNRAVLDKLKKFFDLYYGINPTEAELKKVLHYISKYIWQNEGLDKNIESYFKDMIKYKDKENRGKSLSGLDNHRRIREVLDQVKNGLKKD